MEPAPELNSPGGRRLRLALADGGRRAQSRGLRLTLLARRRLSLNGDGSLRRPVRLTLNGRLMLPAERQGASE